FATSALWFEPWGLAGCALDPEALRNGTVSLLHARGLFPDGLAFHMPDSDPAPEPRAIGELFPPNRESITILLTVPERKQNGLNCVPADSIAGNGNTRFVAEKRLLHDETTGVDEKPVPLGRKNIALALDTEPLEGLQSIPLARVTRDHSGNFVFDRTFIPPCIQITGSDRLMEMLQRLIDILDEKSATLTRPRDKSLAEFSTRDVANFWLLHTVNSALAPLRHLYLTKRGHPEELYVEMARLGGALCTFALESHPRMVPAYDHANLDRTFELLDTHIRRHLETIVPTNCISIPLTKDAEYFYYGTANDQRCFGPSRWVLAIRSPIGEVELITRTPQLVKVCSNVVGELVKRALPGMPLAHLPVPPSAISTKVDTQYFAINKGGPCWEHMMQTKQIGVYIPGEIPSPEAELLVILET
ncbi:MAG TPA: type VI secretion system baseplate subunit TssK, partial [Bryobacteraceae bacterium]|nr:type VI secretion system baseplate subunit TssK [Bryobacteraceae bacterium]